MRSGTRISILQAVNRWILAILLIKLCSQETACMMGAVYIDSMLMSRDRLIIEVKTQGCARLRSRLIP